LPVKPEYKEKGESTSKGKVNLDEEKKKAGGARKRFETEELGDNYLETHKP